MAVLFRALSAPRALTLASDPGRLRCWGGGDGRAPGRGASGGAGGSLADTPASGRGQSQASVTRGGEVAAAAAAETQEPRLTQRVSACESTTYTYTLHTQP